MMELNLLKRFIKIAVIFTFFAISNPVKAQKFDYSLLLGEWSLPGMCNIRRYIYADNGNYSFLEKKQREEKWQPVFQGEYVVKADAVIISEYEDPGGFVFETIKLTKRTYVSKEYTPREGYEDAVTYERCPYR